MKVTTESKVWNGKENDCVKIVSSSISLHKCLSKYVGLVRDNLCYGLSYVCLT